MAAGKKTAKGAHHEQLGFKGSVRLKPSLNHAPGCINRSCHFPALLRFARVVQFLIRRFPRRSRPESGPAGAVTHAAERRSPPPRQSPVTHTLKRRVKVWFRPLGASAQGTEGMTRFDRLKVLSPSKENDERQRSVRPLLTRRHPRHRQQSCPPQVRSQSEIGKEGQNRPLPLRTCGAAAGMLLSSFSASMTLQLQHRALYAAFDRFPSEKGAARHIERMAETLFASANGGVLYVLGSDDLPIYQREDNIEIFRFSEQIPNFMERALHYGRRLDALLAEQADSLRLCHFRDPWSGVPILLRRKKGCAAIYEINGLPSIELPSAYPDISERTLGKIRAAEEFCWSQADAIITPGETLKANLVRLGVPGEKITVIPNGADLPPAVPRPRRRPGTVFNLFRRSPALAGGGHAAARVRAPPGLPRTPVGVLHFNGSETGKDLSQTGGETGCRGPPFLVLQPERSATPALDFPRGRFPRAAHRVRPESRARLLPLENPGVHGCWSARGRFRSSQASGKSSPTAWKAASCIPTDPRNSRAPFASCWSIRSAGRKWDNRLAKKSPGSLHGRHSMQKLRLFYHQWLNGETVLSLGDSPAQPLVLQ